MQRLTKRAWPPALASLALLACSASQPGRSELFTSNWTNDGGKSISAVQERLAKSRLPAGPAVAVGSTASGLVGVGLSGGTPWTHSLRLNASPAVTGGVVVASGEGRVVALDALSGRLLWRVDKLDGRLLGAGDDGKLTAFSLAAGDGSQLVVVDRSGKQLLRENAAAGSLGVPAVLGGIVFVPWGNQYVSALDPANGDELGRLLMREQVSHAVNIGGELYFGQVGLTHFDSAVGGAYENRAHRVTLPRLQLPGNPLWFTDGTRTLPARSAQHSIRLYARPTPDGSAIDSQRFAASYFKIVLGYDVAQAGLRWVQSFDANVVGGAAAQGGFALCLQSGAVQLVAAGGGVTGSADLGRELVSCTVQAGELKLPAAAPKQSLPEQLAQAIQVRETEMVAIQRTLLDKLASLKDPLVTKALIDLCKNPRTPATLLEAARKHLSERRSGAEYMLAALKQHYDYLEDVLRPPPVGPLADALAAMGSSEAAPLLAEHLNDPANSPDDIARAALALEKLAQPAQYVDLKTFFSLYRATADDDELIRAVVAVGNAILRVGGDDGRALIQQATRDPLTNPVVRRALSAQAATPASTSG